MTRTAYRDWKPQTKTEHLLNVVRKSLVADPRQTVRQVFYDLVDQQIVEDNEGGFKKLVRTLTNARMAGLLDWDYLGDTHPGRILQRGESGVEVWVERDSLLAQTVVALQDLDVTVVTFRAYPSTVILHDAIERGVKTVLVPGDDTPRGVDVIRDLQDRLSEFNRQGESGVLPVEVQGLVIIGTDDIERLTPSEYANLVVAGVKARNVGPALEPVVEPSRLGGPVLTAAQAEAIMAEVGETTRAASLKAKLREALS